MARFTIRATWADPPRDEDLSIVERSTFAQVQVCVDDAILTRIGGPDARTHVLGPTSGLAEWIVDNWLSVLWETHTPFPKSGGAGVGRARPPTLRDAVRLWDGFVVDRAAMGRWQQRRRFAAYVAARGVGAVFQRGDY